MALPLVVAAVLIGGARMWPSQWPDAIARLTAAAVAIMAVFLAGARRKRARSSIGTAGGRRARAWQSASTLSSIRPAPDASPVAAAVFCASFVFSWGYFDEVHARYHALMLIFLAAMAGFALTGDLFNLFVFFELMSTVAFALTGYRLESSALEGALNFTVTNGIGSFLMLAGIGLLYGRTGALNFAQLSRALSGHPADGLVILAFVLLIGALFIKGAIVPFHFWIADAHSRGAVPGLRDFFRHHGADRDFRRRPALLERFCRVPGIDQAQLRPLLVWLGAATAVMGGLVALMQRNVKRLLAFSTVSHMGVLLVGVGLLSAGGLAGGMLYLLGHGLVKGRLVHGRGNFAGDPAPGSTRSSCAAPGKEFPITGLTYVLGGLLLAGLPIGLEHQGRELIDSGGRGARLCISRSHAERSLAG